jgi:protein SCO1/2
MAVLVRFLMALGLAAALAGCERSAAPSFKAIDITGAEYAQGFDLPDADGRRRTLADFKGRITLVFFGFTQCPDVCPTTLLEIAEVKKALGAGGERIQGVFVTVDPERDSPEVLKAYVDNFGAGFVALRGNMEETQAVAKAFKVYYAKVPGQAPGSYTMDHTAGTYVFDGEGKVRLFTRYGSGADALKHDLQILLSEPQRN